MKKIFLVLLAVFFFAPSADACVLKMLRIGVLNSAGAQVLSELLAVHINGRTGTKVSVKFYKNTQELYESLKTKQIDIIIENTETAMRLLNKAPDGDLKDALETVTRAYEKEKGLIWLKPFGFLNGNGGRAKSYTAPVIKSDVLNNFPGLPRVLAKLAGAVDDEAYANLIKSIEAGEKPKKAALSFLKLKKLI